VKPFIVAILAACVLPSIALVTLQIERAQAEPMRIIKTVPEGSTLELRVQGKVVQSMSVQPGTYEISIRDVGNDGAVHGRPRRHR
jgi:hypothetical protein